MRRATVRRASDDLELVELGRLVCLAWHDEGSGRRRVARWAYRHAPVLAYDPQRARACLHVCYGERHVGTARARDVLEYARTHWGRLGDMSRVEATLLDGETVALGPAERVIYATRKGDDDELVDYDHEFGHGATGRWEPPIVHTAPAGTRGAARGTLRLVGGTYRVTSHGIVG